MPPPTTRVPFTFSVPHPGPEWMDDPAVERGVLLEAYRDLAFINRVSGGWRAVRRGLDRFVQPVTGRPWRVLDVGFGSADLWPVIRGWAAARGATAQFLGLDLNASHSTVQPGAQGAADLLLTGDALRPPFKAGSVDLAFSSQTLHHLDRAMVPAFMAALARLGRQGALIMDLERNFPTWAATWLGTRLFLLGPMVRCDGPLSVRRSFRVRELHALARQAGLKIQVMSSFPGRLLIYIPPQEVERQKQ